MGADVGVGEVAGDGARTGSRGIDFVAGAVDGDAAGARGFQLQVSVHIDLLEADPAAAGNPGGDVAFRDQVVNVDAAGTGRSPLS